MKRRIYTIHDLIEMSTLEIRLFQCLIDAQAFRLLGMDWKKQIRYWKDPITDSLIFEWE